MRVNIIELLNSDHSIIVEYCKGKQTYLHSLSLKNKILRYVHPIAYNNIYSLTLCGKGIALHKSIVERVNRKGIC